MKELYKLVDKKTAFTASVVCVTFVILVGILGVIGRTSYSPYLIENFFGVADDLSKSTNRVANDIETVILAHLSTHENPAGYSRTFTYDDNGPGVSVRQTLIFYARADQFVKIDVTSNGYLTGRNAVANADRGSYQVGVDDNKWPHTNRAVGESEEIIIDGNDLPKVTNGVGTGSHTLIVSPVAGSHHYKEITSYDCLVLVSNRSF